MGQEENTHKEQDERFKAMGAKIGGRTGEVFDR